ncbi:Lipid A deacylase PagL [Pseudomonas donghuensis]
MFLMKKLLCLAALAAVTLGQSFTTQAADVSLSVGQTGDSTMTYRLGLQSNWDASWWQTSVGRITGYWDGAYTYWDGDETASNHSLSFSPVFVYEFAGESVKPYIEAGIGVAAFSSTELESNELGSSFQFEDRIGFGLRFAGGHEVGVRAIHYSNAGLKMPNDGVESYSLHYRMPL